MKFVTILNKNANFAKDCKKIANISKCHGEKNNLFRQTIEEKLQNSPENCRNKNVCLLKKNN